MDRIFEEGFCIGLDFMGYYGILVWSAVYHGLRMVGG